MTNKKSHSTKEIINKERWNITILFLSSTFFLFLLIGIIFSAMNLGRLQSNAYNNIYNVASFAYDSYVMGTKESIIKESQKDEDDDLKYLESFVVLKDVNGNFIWIQGDPNNEVYSTIFEQIQNSDLTQDGKSEASLNNFYYGVYDSTFYNREIAPKALSFGVHMNMGEVIYASIDVGMLIEDTTQMNFWLTIVLLIIFIIDIPVSYRISGLLIRPTIEAMKREKDFVANTSHELKTPLAIINANATLLSEKYPSSDHYVNVITSQCEKMNQIVLDMINLSKLEVMTFEIKKVNVSEMVYRLCISCDALAFENGIDYQYDVQENLILNKADERVLHRIFDILMDNAIKYVSGEKKIIRISLKKEKSKIVFEIYNTGCEVTDDNLDRIFDRFYQGKSGSDVEKISSGLGLAIVSEACIEMKYKLSVESEYHQFMKFRIEF